jgi:two-component system, chemotaxis family, chemotaxis protein CheY
MAKTIMVVDDSPLMRASLKANLELGGYRVEYAGDGVLALTQLKGGAKPDLIISDVNMPNMGGLEFIRTLRTLPGFRFTPVLMLTTESLQAKKDEAKKNGATGWLVKPITGPELIKVIKQVLPGA